MSEHCSLKPQKLKKKSKELEWWYYENPQSIDVYIDAVSLQACAREGHGYHIRIPKRLLQASLQRMNGRRG